MKKIYIYLMAGLVLAGCSKATDTLTPQRIQEPESQQQQAPDAPDTPDTFTLKVETVATKALIDNGQTLGSEWKQGDSISVYNSTTEEKIEGWLKATTDGPTTVFEGTVSGTINQGDILVLRYLTRNYENQDGTLEGLAKQCDYACAQVEVTGIDSEAKTISTEQANFEKVQAVVKFSITNRKENPEAVSVKSFSGTCKPSFSEFPISIHVTPQTPTNELYVAIPPLWNQDITFEAEGADGYAYRLIVSDVSFEEGLYYRRTLRMKRKALVKAPVAKANLSYTSAPLALVDSAHVYWKVNDQEEILDHDKDSQQESCVISYFVKKEDPTAPTAEENGWLTSIPTQTHAGTYYVWTKMTGNDDYEDADVSAQPVKVVIAKATASLNVSANTNNLTYNGSSQSLLSDAAALKIGNTVVTTAEDAENKTCTIQYCVSTSKTSTTDGSWGTSYNATNAKTYYVWVKVTGNGDINDIAAAYKVEKAIAKANWTVSAPTAISGLVYNGTSQNLCSAGSASGVSGQTAELEFSFDGNTYGSNRAKTTANYGNARTIYWRTKANDNYNQSSGSISVTMQRKQGWCSVSPNSNYFDNHTEVCNITISCHGGSLSHNSQYYDVNFNGTTSGTIQHKSSSGANWNETITITSGATENYTSASCTFACS